MPHQIVRLQNFVTAKWVAKFAIKFIRITNLLMVCVFSTALMAQSEDPRSRAVNSTNVHFGEITEYRLKYYDGTEQVLTENQYEQKSLQSGKAYKGFIENPSFETFQQFSDLQKLDDISNALLFFHMGYKLKPHESYVLSLVDSTSNSIVRLAATLAMRQIQVRDFDRDLSGFASVSREDAYLKLYKIAGAQTVQGQEAALCELADGSNYMLNSSFNKNDPSDFDYRLSQSELKLLKLLVQNSVSGLNPQNIMCPRKVTSLSKGNFFLSDVIGGLETLVAKKQNSSNQSLTQTAAADNIERSSCSMEQISLVIDGAYNQAKNMAPGVNHLAGISDQDCFIRGILTKETSGIINFSMHPRWRLGHKIRISVDESKTKNGLRELKEKILMTQLIASIKTPSVERVNSHTNKIEPVEPGHIIYNVFKVAH